MLPVVAHAAWVDAQYLLLRTATTALHDPKVKLGPLLEQVWRMKEDMLARARMERAATVTSWTQVLAPVAGISVVAGLLGAFVTVSEYLPTTSSPAWVAAGLTAGSLFVGALVGIAIQRKMAD